MSDKNLNIDKEILEKATLIRFEKFLDKAEGDLKWKRYKRILYMVAFVGFIGLMWMTQLSEMGYEVMPKNKSIAIVPVEGVIAKGQPASADALIPILNKLFKSNTIEAIVLSIQSGGGSPTESERIYKEIERLKAETDKEVITVCSNVCGSAAYMLAIRGDEVYAGDYTLVGSIGAIMQSWDFSDSIKIADAKYRVFESGPYKDLLNPYKKLEGYKTERLTALVKEMAGVFKNDVINKRGEKLKVNEDLFSGNVWSAKDALEYGLIDRIATLEEVATEKWPDIKTVRFNPRVKKSDFLDRMFGYVDMKIDQYLNVRQSGSLEVRF